MTWRDCSSVSCLLYLFVYLAVFAALDSELLEEKDSVVHLLNFIASIRPLGRDLMLNEIFF